MTPELYHILLKNVILFSRPTLVPRARKQAVYMNKDSIALRNKKQKLWKNKF